MSRIGRKPILIPENTKIEVKDGFVVVSGPKGSLSRRILPGLEISIEGNQLFVKRNGDDKKTKAYHGLMRTLINNMVEGVVRGYEKKLEIVGIGYRAEMKGKDVVFHLGYSHPIVFKVPEGIQLEVEKQNLVAVRGIDKELVGIVAAKIRSLRKPDVYKNKGIKYVDEILRKKAGKGGK
ncbi:MAG: 50S ribosomal protein L6 [Desulfobacterota bacterium]|nr:50S ribosomal protein L6 [Thermodesulfobacteriota bacterium]MDW8002389.1 50S ribosomal protein L6 [Deltaproteobacteria bacterium]